MRFTLARHEKPGDPHYDLFLEPESGGSLMTWNLHTVPAAGAATSARRIADHRRIYLEFEGEISGGRGSTAIVDTGECEWLERTDERIRVRLAGRLLAGPCELTRRSGDVWELKHGAAGSRSNS